MPVPMGTRHWSPFLFPIVCLLTSFSVQCHSLPHCFSRQTMGKCLHQKEDVTSVICNCKFSCELEVCVQSDARLQRMPHCAGLLPGHTALDCERKALPREGDTTESQVTAPQMTTTVSALYTATRRVLQPNSQAHCHMELLH